MDGETLIHIKLPSKRTKMAEQQTEQDDLVEGTPGYKAPAQKSLDEILDTDADDEALKRYKEQLLGNVAKGECAFPEDPRNVIVSKLVFEPEGRDAVELDLSGDIKKFKSNPFIIKEGCKYKMAVQFFVQREIVCGLRYNQVTYRKGVKVDKDSFMVGSYGPKTESQTYYTPVEEAPSGVLMRGSYTVKSLFTDDDKNEYLKWDWAFEIKKDWGK